MPLVVFAPATVAVILAGLVGGTLLVRRRGYNVGGRVIVRCNAGHFFAALWIPGASVKSIRLGWWRIQRCPVGHHWTMVAPVRVVSLTEDQRRQAEQYSDGPIP